MELQKEYSMADSGAGGIGSADFQKLAQRLYQAARVSKSVL